MLKRNNFFKDDLKNLKNYKKNKTKTKKVFQSFLKDFKKNKIPTLEPFKKDYKFDFSTSTVKKFYKCKNIIIIGMGGSILGAKSIYSFFKKKIKKKIFFFDNLDLNLNHEFKKIKNIEKSCIIAVSKSGNTLETISNLGAIFSKKLIKNKLLIITETNNNSLMYIANKYNAEIVEHKNYIGGRYSVLSETGMLPASIMGLNLNKLKNLSRFLKNKDFVNSLIENVTAIYSLNLKGIKNSVILNYDSDLNDLSYWYQQLVAESLGKKGKGVNPIISFGPKDHHSLLQLYLDGPKDKFFTILNSQSVKSNIKIYNRFAPYDMEFLNNKNLKSIIDAQCYATKKIFKLKKIPLRTIIFNKKNEEELGKIFAFFILETILLARLMNINPFDQPAVEAVKIETKKFLNY